MVWNVLEIHANITLQTVAWLFSWHQLYKVVSINCQLNFHKTLINSYRSITLALKFIRDDGEDCKRKKYWNCFARQSFLNKSVQKKSPPTPGGFLQNESFCSIFNPLPFLSLLSFLTIIYNYLVKVIRAVECVLSLVEGRKWGW